MHKPNFLNKLAPRMWLLIAAALGLAVALPVRVLQQLFGAQIDPTFGVENFTGFWVDSGHITVILLYIFMALPLVASVALAVMMRNTVAVDLQRKPRKAEGYISLVAALFVLISAVLVFLQTMAAMLAAREVGEAAFGAGVLAAIFEGIFGLGVVAFFVNLGLVNLFPTGKIYLYRVLTLMPLLWVITRLLGYFSRTISYLRVSDLLINIAAAALLLVFFMAMAQVITGVNAEKKTWRLAAVGLPAAVILLVAFFPRLVAAGFGDVFPSQDAVLDLADLGVALFVGVFMFTRLRTKEPEEIAAEEPVETDEIQSEEHLPVDVIPEQEEVVPVFQEQVITEEV